MPLTFNLKKDVRYQQGKLEGLQKGEVRKQQEIARESLKNGGTVEFTAKITGLSLKVVLDIKAGLERGESS